METFKLKSHIGRDGLLRLEVPTGLSAREVEVLLVIESPSDISVDSNGWPVGFFERTYGSLSNDPIERPAQLPLEERNPVEYITKN